MLCCSKNWGLNGFLTVLDAMSRWRSSCTWLRCLRSFLSLISVLTWVTHRLFSGLWRIRRQDIALRESRLQVSASVNTQAKVRMMTRFLASIVWRSGRIWGRLALTTSLHSWWLTKLSVCLVTWSTILLLAREVSQSHANILACKCWGRTLICVYSKVTVSVVKPVTKE